MYNRSYNKTKLTALNDGERDKYEEGLRHKNQKKTHQQAKTRRTELIEKGLSSQCTKLQ